MMFTPPVRRSWPVHAAAPSAPDTTASSPCSADTRPDRRFPETSARDIPSSTIAVRCSSGSRAIARSTRRVMSLRATRSSIDSDGSAAAARSIRSTPSGACIIGRPALAPHPVAAQVQRDSVEPRREFRLSAKARQCAERPQEGLLADVARVFLASDRAVREGIDGPFPSQDELIETVGVAADRSRDEFFVGPRHAERGGSLSSP